MNNGHEPALAEIAQYYSDKLAEFGETPLGVDWNGEEGQKLRFAQLSKVIRPSAVFSINDLGCGYGALRDFLAERHAPGSRQSNPPRRGRAGGTLRGSRRRPTCPRRHGPTARRPRARR